MEPYSDIATATLVFLTCSFGLIGIILAMALLLYRVNVRARHQRQIQDHIATIHAILEEGVGEVEEDIVVPDDPPDYEAPPDYEEIVNLKYLKCIETTRLHNKKYSRCSLTKSSENMPGILSSDPSEPTNASENCESTSAIAVPDSPPPSYEDLRNFIDEQHKLATSTSSCSQRAASESPSPGPSNVHFERENPEGCATHETEREEDKCANYFENMQRYRTQFLTEIRKGFRNCKSVNLIKHAKELMSFSEENLVRYFSESELICISNNNRRCWASRCKLKKSFSTDDIISLL